MSNHFALAERLIAVANKEKAKWLVAAARESKKTDDFAEDREETCLVCANAVLQVITLMERELRLARYAAQGMETRRAETGNTDSVAKP